MTNRNDYGFPDLSRRDDLDADLGDTGRGARSRSVSAIIALVVLGLISAAGSVLILLFFWVAKGGL